MNNFGSDKKPLSFDDYDSQSPKILQTSPNADIEYLLSYITLDESQQLNLTQNIIKQDNDLESISNQTLYRYITKNTHLETGSLKQRQVLVSIIDFGVNLISGIKRVMQKKKVDQRKNKSAISPFEMFRELFFGKQPSSQENQYGGQEFGIRKSTGILMEQLRRNSQAEILLAKISQNDENIGNAMEKTNFLLIKSLKERVQQRAKESKRQQQLQVNIRELEQNLIVLEEYRDKGSSDSIDSSEQQKRLTEVWSLIDRISAQL